MLLNESGKYAFCNQTFFFFDMLNCIINENTLDFDYYIIGNIQYCNKMHNNTNSNNNVHFKNYPEFTHSHKVKNVSPQNAVSGKLIVWKKHTTKQSLLGILYQNVTD